MKSASAKKLTAPIWIAATVGALFIAVGVGVWAGARKHRAQAARGEVERLKTVREGVRSVRDVFDQDLEAVKNAALGLPEATSFSNGILLWAELDSSAQGASGIKRTLLNPGWNLQPGDLEKIQSSFLSAAIAYLNQPQRWRDIREGKTELLRVKKDDTGPDEWLALAFGTTQTAPALGANFAGSTVLVVIDPAVAFASVPAWGVRGETRGLRSYLASSDGRVLTHSLSRFDGAELGGSASFRAALAAIAQAQTDKRPMGGSALVKKIEGEEGAAVTLAATRASSLPLYLIVEKTLELPKAVPVRGQKALLSAPSPYPEPSTGGIRARKGLGIAVILGVLIGAAMYLFQLMQRNASAARAQALVLQAELEARRAREEVYLAQVRAEEEARVREELRLEDDARRAEEARKQEILGRIQAAEKELVRKFELEVLRQGDPKKIACSISSLANQLCRAPALFFAYQPINRKALLTSSVGLPLSTKTAPFMFELGDDILRKIQEADLRGETLSLSSYLPLSSVIQLHLRVGKFRAWALTGETKQDWSGQAHARLLGVLVVLPSREGKPLPVGQWIPGMLKAAGRQYEKALPQE